MCSILSLRSRYERKRGKRMKNVIMPKCPYCKLEYKARGLFTNALSNLYGEYSSNTAEIICVNCKKG